MRQRPASVWTLRAFRAMARLACTSIITFDQCIFDLPAQKPTTYYFWFDFPTLRTLSAAVVVLVGAATPEDISLREDEMMLASSARLGPKYIPSQ